MRFVYVTDDPRDPRFGRAFPCPSNCNQTERQKRLDRYCGLVGEQLTFSFEGLSWTPRQADAIETLRGCLQKTPPSGIVVLIGPPGVGKTLLMMASVNWARLAGWSAMYSHLENLLDHLRKAYAPEATIGYDGVWESITRSTVLALDEIGRENPTPWARAKLFELIDLRYTQALFGRMNERTLTLFASNLGLDQLDSYLASRLGDRRNTIIDLRNHPDMRRNKQPQ